MVQWPCGLDEWLPQVSGLNGVILRIWRFDSWSSCWVSQNHQPQRPVPGQAGNFAQSVAGHHQPLELFANGDLYRFDMPMFRSGQIESYISESGETRRRGQAMWCTFYLHRAPAWVSPGLDFQQSSEGFWRHSRNLARVRLKIDPFTYWFRIFQDPELKPVQLHLASWGPTLGAWKCVQ